MGLNFIHEPHDIFTLYCQGFINNTIRCFLTFNCAYVVISIQVREKKIIFGKGYTGVILVQDYFCIMYWCVFKKKKNTSTLISIVAYEGQ